MESLLRRVYTSKKISLSLKIISHAAALICVAVYISALVISYLREPMQCVKLLLAAGIPFLLVSVARKLIGAPRPYELYDFYEAKPKERMGQSFPSRHVFSAFIIAVLAYPASLWLSLAALLMGTVLAVSRVLLGMHFIRDVAAGALCGIVCGVLGAIILV